MKLMEHKKNRKVYREAVKDLKRGNYEENASNFLDLLKKAKEHKINRKVKHQLKRYFRIKSNEGFIYEGEARDYISYKEEKIIEKILGKKKLSRLELVIEK